MFTLSVVAIVFIMVMLRNKHDGETVPARLFNAGLVAFVAFFAVELGNSVIKLVSYGQMYVELKNDAADIHCDLGPITKTIGDHNWVVHGCTDDETLMFSEESRHHEATPNIILSRHNNDYVAQPVGSGEFPDENDLDAFRKLTQDEINALLAEVAATQNQ